MEKREIFRYVSDGFALPGFLCLFWGGLRFLWSQGAFSGLSYILGRRKRDYCPEKKKFSGKNWLLVGAVSLSIAAIFAAASLG